MLENYELDSREITVDRVTDSAIQKKQNQARNQVFHSWKCKYYAGGAVNLISNFFNIKNVRPGILLFLRRTEKKWAAEVEDWLSSYAWATRSLAVPNPQWRIVWCQVDFLFDSFVWLKALIWTTVT